MIIMYTKRKDILKYHDTISSFCAFCHTWENRFLLMFCLIVTSNLLCLQFEEFNARISYQAYDAQIILFVIEIICIMSFPLVGIFYTEGKHPDPSQHNKDYECPYGTCNIKTSEKFHKCGAMTFFTGLTITSIIWSIIFLTSWKDSQNYYSIAIGFTVWSVFQLILAICFILVQIILAKHYRIRKAYDRIHTQDVDDDDGDIVGNNDETEKMELQTIKDEDENEEMKDAKVERQLTEEEITEQNKYILIATKLRYASFAMEGTWAASVIAITTLMSLVRNNGFDWKWNDDLI